MAHSWVVPALWPWRNNKYPPAVTRVDEWTNEETGVGAAMAAGSHALKGICALFVKEPTIKSNFKMVSTSKNSLYNTILQEPKFNSIPILISKRTSPKRFVITVSIPALYDLVLP